VFSYLDILITKEATCMRALVHDSEHGMCPAFQHSSLMRCPSGATSGSSMLPGQLPD
jgi:hypothetical protein